MSYSVPGWNGSFHEDEPFYTDPFFSLYFGMGKCDSNGIRFKRSVNIFVENHAFIETLIKRNPHLNFNQVLNLIIANARRCFLSDIESYHRYESSTTDPDCAAYALSLFDKQYKETLYNTVVEVNPDFTSVLSEFVAADTINCEGQSNG